MDELPITDALLRALAAHGFRQSRPDLWVYTFFCCGNPCARPERVVVSVRPDLGRHTAKVAVSAMDAAGIAAGTRLVRRLVATLPSVSCSNPTIYSMPRVLGPAFRELN